MATYIKQRESIENDRDAAIRKAAIRKADILKALAHPDRIRIFEALSSGERAVGEIVEMLGAKPAITSRHLAVLRGAGLIAARKEGLNVYYANKMPCLLSMLACVEQAVCTIAEEHVRVAACMNKGIGLLTIDDRRLAPEIGPQPRLSKGEDKSGGARRAPAKRRV